MYTIKWRRYFGPVIFITLLIVGLRYLRFVYLRLSTRWFQTTSPPPAPLREKHAHRRESSTIRHEGILATQLHLLLYYTAVIDCVIAPTAITSETRISKQAGAYLLQWHPIKNTRSYQQIRLYDIFPTIPLSMPCASNLVVQKIKFERQPHGGTMTLLITVLEVGLSMATRLQSLLRTSATNNDCLRPQWHAQLAKNIHKQQVPQRSSKKFTWIQSPHTLGILYVAAQCKLQYRYLPFLVII